VTDENGKKVINKEHTGLDVQLPGRSGVANMCRSGNEWPPLLIIQEQVKFDVRTDQTVMITAHWPFDALQSGRNSIFSEKTCYLHLSEQSKVRSFRSIALLTFLS
jgi:hypothetical protein